MVNRADLAAARVRRDYNGSKVDPRYRITTAQVIERLNITEAEMVAGNFRHYVTKEIKLEHERERGRQRRREAGQIDRGEYEINSLSRLRPWEAEEISRATWYRRRENTTATSSETSPSGCMVVKPDAFPSTGFATSPSSAVVITKQNAA